MNWNNLREKPADRRRRLIRQIVAGLFLFLVIAGMTGMRSGCKWLRDALPRTGENVG